MALLQKASSGKMEKGSSIWMPTWYEHIPHEHSSRVAMAIFLDLNTHLFDAKEEECDDELGRDGRPVIPRLAQLAPERERQ